LLTVVDIPPPIRELSGMCKAPREVMDNKVRTGLSELKSSETIIV